jgi:hypothetical protein
MTVNDNAPPALALARKIGIAGLRGDRSQPVYWSTLLALAKQRTIVICWLGNQHAHFFFANTGVFDFYCKSRPDDPIIPGAQLVPEEMVRAHFRQTMDDLIALIGDLRAAGAARIVVLGSPATRGEASELRRHFADNPAFISEAKALGFDADTVPLTALSVNVKLWAVVQDVLRETAESHADLFIPSPAETCFDDGTLKIQYWLGDGCHGNYEYGCLALEKIAGAVAS